MTTYYQVCNTCNCFIHYIYMACLFDFKVQCQMFSTKRIYCDFMLWTETTYMLKEFTQIRSFGTIEFRFFYNGYFTWTDGEILFSHYAWSVYSLRNRFVVAVTSRGSNFPNLLLLSWTWWRHNGGMWQSNLWIPLFPSWLPWLEIRAEIKELVLSWLQETTWLPK